MQKIITFFEILFFLGIAWVLILVGAGLWELFLDIRFERRSSSLSYRIRELEKLSSLKTHEASLVIRTILKPDAPNLLHPDHTLSDGEKWRLDQHLKKIRGLPYQEGDLYDPNRNTFLELETLEEWLTACGRVRRAISEESAREEARLAEQRERRQAEAEAKKRAKRQEADAKRQARKLEEARRKTAAKKVVPKSSASPPLSSGTSTPEGTSLSEWRTGYQEMSARHLETLSSLLNNIVFGDQETQKRATDLVNASAQMLLNYALAAAEQFPGHVDEFERAYQDTIRRHQDILAGRT